MPPFEGGDNNSTSQFGSDAFLTVVNNRLVSPETSPTMPDKADMWLDTSSPPVLAERDVIIGANPLFDVPLPQQEERQKSFSQNACQYGHCGTTKPMDFLDIFSSMCLGPRQQQQPKQRATNKKASSRKRVMYPIAKYPARLNNSLLVQQRRRSLHKHLTFKPVEERESSMSSLHTVTHVQVYPEPPVIVSL